MITCEQHMFGPLLCKTTLNNEDVNKVKKLCSKKNKDLSSSRIIIMNIIDEKKYAQIFLILSTF